jgi:membrane protease YdiL (CAAX protease family)
LKKDLLPALAAILLFLPLFAWRRLGPADFWWWMGGNIGILCVLGFALDPSFRADLRRDFTLNVAEKLFLGVMAAAGLYFAFVAGGFLVRALFPAAAGRIAEVYSFKSSASILRIALLIAFLIGPGEEVFWRGLLQRRLDRRFGFPLGWLAASALYAAVHLSSGNAVLVASAGVCGLYWGALYGRSRSVLLVAVSHTVWDLLIFLVFPLG